MDNISKQKLDAKRENAKRHNDSDYELRQSIDRYYEKKWISKIHIYGIYWLPVLGGGFSDDFIINRRICSLDNCWIYFNYWRWYVCGLP